MSGFDLGRAHLDGTVVVLATDDASWWPVWASFAWLITAVGVASDIMVWPWSALTPCVISTPSRSPRDNHQLLNQGGFRLR